MDGGTAGGKQRTDSTFVLANVRGLSRQDQCRREPESGSERDRRSGRLSGCWELSARTGLIAMCIALSCNAFPKASRRKPSCANRWEKIAGRGSQAALDEHAPQRVRDYSSLGLLQQVWNQHFERVEGRIGFRDGPAVESAERVISLISRPMRGPAASATPNGWVISVHLTETCGEEDAVHLIMQAEITPATEQDVEETMPLLDDVQARDLVPEVRLVVSSYVSGDVLAKHAALGIE
jgi:hypothetical protein